MKLTEIADNEPLIITLIKQRLKKNEPIFLLKAGNSKPARIRNVTFIDGSMRLQIDGIGVAKNGKEVKTVAHFTTSSGNGPIDDRFDIDKGKLGWMLYDKLDPASRVKHHEAK